MKKTLQTFRYLSKDFSRMIIIGFVSILVSGAITVLIFHLTGGNNPVYRDVVFTAPFELTAGVFALLFGLLLFIGNFKVTLANGISRKTFLLANLSAAGIIAAAFSIFNLTSVQIHAGFWNFILFSVVFYPDINWTGLLILQFALYFLLIMIGWFITLAYYRSSVLVKWIISLSPVGLYYLLRVVNALSGGATFTSIWIYFHWSTFNPYRTGISFLAYAAILYGLVYLLIRRAPLKD